jgi:hypothetical protein
MQRIRRPLRALPGCAGAAPCSPQLPSRKASEPGTKTTGWPWNISLPMYSNQNAMI